MFNSQLHLSRKGALSTIWVAAHCFARVKKEQVAETKISFSVDKILLDEVPVATYRVLGYLLLGVVKMYSKKVEYLFNDCHQVLVEVNDFVGIKIANKHIKDICPTYLSVTRPERLELDAFDLQIVEDGAGVNVRPDKDITLGDAREGTEHNSSDKCHREEGAAYVETCFTSYTPVKNVCSLYIMESDMASRSHNLSNLESSIENLLGNKFSLEERLDPLPLGEIEELVRPLGEKCQTDGERIKFPDSENVIGAEEQSPDTVRLFDKEQHMSLDHAEFPKMIPSESRKCEISMKDSPVAINMEATPQHKCSNVTGATTPKFMVVRTPGAKERASFSRKRKWFYDDIITLPNKVLKESIDKSNDLIRKRRKAPHTALHVWKAHQISNLPQTFFEPCIPCISSELRSLFNAKQLKSPEAVETMEAPEKLDILTVHGSPDEIDIAPSTPGTLSNWRFCGDDVPENTYLDKVGPASSFETREKGCASEDKELGIPLLNEGTNSYERANQETNEWSIRTRTLAKYLCRTFLDRKRQGKDEVLNLSEFLKQKTKSASARIFYEILVLKNGDYIEVKQDAPYDDILLLDTPKLKPLFEADEAYDCA